MAQTTGGMSWVNCQVKWSSDNSTFTDISGQFNKIAISGGERQTGETYTMDGDVAIVTAGKIAPYTITGNFVYSEVTGEAMQVFWTQYTTADGGDVYLKWSPGGGDTGDWAWATARCEVVSAYHDEGDTGSGAPAMGTLVAKTSQITKSLLAAAM